MRPCVEGDFNAVMLRESVFRLRRKRIMQNLFTIYPPRINSSQVDISSFASRKGAVALFAGLFFFVISIAGYAGLYYLNKSQENTQAQLIAQIGQKEDDLRPKLLDEIFSLQKKLKTISGILSSHPFPANTFNLVERNTHPRISFSSYAFSPKDRKITLKGEADNYGVIARQIAFLEGDQQIDKVEFGGLALKENRRVSFDMTIYIMPNAIAAPQ